LSQEIAMEIISEGFELAYRRLHLTGGEPFLWDSLFGFVDFAFDIGYGSVFLNSNGTRLTKDTCIQLSKFDGFSLSVSLEVTQSIHDHYRGDRSYHKSLEGIQNALAAGLQTCIFAVVTRNNMACLPQFAELIHKNFPTIESLLLIPLVSFGNSFSLFDELLDPKDYVRLVQTAGLINLYGVRTSLLSNPLANAVAKKIGMPWIPYSAPEYRKGSMMILANRDMALSHSSDSILGKYQTGMVKAVLESDEYENLTRPDSTICKDCEYAENCREGDLIRPIVDDSPTSGVSPYCRSVLSKATT